MEFLESGRQWLGREQLGSTAKIMEHSHTISECKPQGVRVKNSQYYNTLVFIQWNLSSPDTNGAEESGRQWLGREQLGSTAKIMETLPHNL